MKSQQSETCDTDISYESDNQSDSGYSQPWGNSAILEQMSSDEECTNKLVFGGIVVGHASPRWDNTGQSDRSSLNEALSHDRASTVEANLENALLNLLGSERMDYNLQELVGPDTSEDDISTYAMGDQQTLQEACGDTQANDYTMRRAEIAVLVTEDICDTRQETISEEYEYLVPESCDPTATNQWAIKLAISGGAGHAGIGGGFAIGELKNKRTGDVVMGQFGGVGPGIGLSSPGADPGWGSFTDFTTTSHVTFEDFDQTLCNLSSAGAGIAIIGGSIALISFPLLGTGLINVSGFNMGAVGADASSNTGVWNLDRIPTGNCTPERTETRTRNREVTVPDNTRRTEVYNHTVYFDTGSSEISASEMDNLTYFAEELSSRIWQ